MADISIPPPTNSFVNPLLTDLYQVTMCYAYWRENRHNEYAVFDLFFRKNPFAGEFTVFAGLDEVIRHVTHFKVTEQQINTLKTMDAFKDWNPEFWIFLSSISTSNVKIYAVDEALPVFPRIPLIRVEGPLAVCQLLETTLLALVNYASLVTTNAVRHRLAASKNTQLLEFGLRRAQGPDGGMSASRYCYMGLFDGSSNVEAGMFWGIPIKGTHAHAFVTSFSSINQLSTTKLLNKNTNKVEDFVESVFKYRKLLKFENSNTSELVAFISYAISYPNVFLALVDTYDTLTSGVPNFCAVGFALLEFGYIPQGIRLDSGDLAYLSKKSREIFINTTKTVNNHYDLSKCKIVASNDITEEVIYNLNLQGHEIDSFGIGTNLVTCKTQPALGCVYKLVEINGVPRIKVSQDSAKVTIPGRKEAFRLYDSTGLAICDTMIQANSPEPKVGCRVLCRHPFDEKKRLYVIPSKVEKLHKLYFDGRPVIPLPSLLDLRDRLSKAMLYIREDVKRHLNPTPYKVAVSNELFSFIQDLWMQELPIPEVS